jgi:uncharacterized membrane protein required for colicin V production
MNVIDYILIIIVFLYTVSGIAKGLRKQLYSLLSMLLGVIVGYLFYKRTMNVFSFFVVFIIAKLVFSIIFYGLDKFYFRSRKELPKVSAAQRLGGGLIGGFKGVVTAVVLLLCLHIAVSFLGSSNSAFVEYIDGSFFYRFFMDSPMLPNVSVANNLYYAGKLLNEHSKRDSFVNDDVMQRLQNNSSFQSVLQDKDLLEHLQQKDYTAVLSDPKFHNLLKDKEFLHLISALDFEKIYNTKGRQKPEGKDLKDTR